MPAWMHERAEHILAKNPSMPKSEAFAIATQQSHALGKSPKGYGTAEGRATAKAKFDTPKDDKKTANPGGLTSSKMEKKALVGPLADVALAGLPSAIGYGMGAKRGISMAEQKEPIDKRSLLAMLLVPGAIGYRSGKEHGHEAQSTVNQINEALAAAGHSGRAKVKQAMNSISLAGFRDELQKIAAEKDSGFMDSLKGAFTTPIAGTPDLFGGVKNSIEHATRGGKPGAGPSSDFLKFQKQRAAQMGKTAAFLDELAKIGGLFPVPAVPLVNPGMNVVFASKPRTISQPIQPVK